MTGSQEHPQQNGQRSRMVQMYLRFGAMISTVVMFILTYSNAYALDHVRWSEERFYMALVMGSSMGVIMLGYMWSMYQDLRVNAAIVLGAIVLFFLALWLSRSQHFVDDEEYMKGMIPHHSIAILTSERADIDDLRVRELADGISETQRIEIAEMDWLLEDIGCLRILRRMAPPLLRPKPKRGPYRSFTPKIRHRMVQSALAVRQTEA